MADHVITMISTVDLLHIARKGWKVVSPSTGEGGLPGKTLFRSHWSLWFPWFPFFADGSSNEKPRYNESLLLLLGNKVQYPKGGSPALVVLTKNRGNLKVKVQDLSFKTLSACLSGSNGFSPSQLNTSIKWYFCGRSESSWNESQYSAPFWPPSVFYLWAISQFNTAMKDPRQFW